MTTHHLATSTANSLTHTLIDGKTAWQQACDKHANADANTPALALIIVSKGAVIDDERIWHILSAWQQHWCITPLADTPPNTPRAQTYPLTNHETLTPVSVQRYLLTPTHALAQGDTHSLRQHILSSLDTKEIAKIDVHAMPASVMLEGKKIACFDMDSTLIHQEVIVELAKFCGIEKEVANITEAAMRGEMDFATSFTKRVALLKGMDAHVIDAIIKQRISFSAGAKTTIQALKALGYHTALISGGFTPFARHVADTLGIDEYHANPLHTQDGKLTGEIGDFILDGKMKAVIVGQIAKRLGVDSTQAICIGDGANDLPMMAISGLGIAYHAKPIVASKADTAIDITGLEGVLYALGHQLITA